MWRFVATVLCFTASGALALPRGALYPHGEGLDQALQKGDDESTPELPLRHPILFYGEVYETIYVNTNGLVSFRTEIPSFFNVPFPLEYPLVAPFYSNVDTRGAGVVWYRESEEPSVLKRATDTVRAAFSEAKDFAARSVFIVTWDNVGYNNEGTDKLNTYQVALISGSGESYAELLYPQGGLQWHQGTGGASGLPDARAQAGIGSEDGRLHVLRGSGTDQVLNLDKFSNTGTSGQWLYRVGPLDDDEEIIEPDLASSSNSVSTGPVSCMSGGTAHCHFKATCTDTESGFCCSCNEGYYGNGYSCLKRDIPLRVTGKVGGTINGSEFPQMDLQSYVVMSDGRAYTALSKVPESYGYDLQVLNVLGGVIGWLFARPTGVARNGYQFTGGVFNHTSVISFPESGKKVTVVQRYTGLDLFDQLKMEADITGELPTLPPGSRIDMEEFEEEYTNPAPGDIRSVAKHTYRVKGVEGPPAQIDIIQHISYKPCPYARGESTVEPLILRVSKNFIGYESREKILRYGMSDKISSAGQTDPCADGTAKCGDNSACVADGDSHQCVCDTGFQYLYQQDTSQGAICVDVNECQIGSNDCDINAQCINEPGSFNCMCHPQFTGDGRSCTAVVNEPCEVINRCSPYASCSKERECICQSGYVGDGKECRAETQAGNTTPSEDISIKDVSATCVLGVCWCPDGYNKEGNMCTLIADSTTIGPEEDVGSRPLPQCLTSDRCSCPEGYEYATDSRSCNPIPGYPLDTQGPSGSHISCNIVNTCHPHAQCVYSYKDGDYHCECNSGYDGDGLECEAMDLSCIEVDICDVHAACVHNKNSSSYECVCNVGYHGDGTVCSVDAKCRSHSDCGADAECLFSSSTERYECLCKESFERDENEACVRIGACGAIVCAENAKCIWDDDQAIYYCECEAGFDGDGVVRCQEPAPACNVINNCALHATCQANQSTGAYSCACSDGYTGDGVSCSPVSTCFDEPGLCQPHSHCATGQYGPHCQCDEGFIGNSTHCKPVNTHETGFLLLNQGMSTLRVPFKPTARDVGRPIQISYYQMAIGLDADCVEGRIYWSDIAGKAIKSSKYDGTAQKDFLTTDIGSPEGLSVDWDSRLLYWTDSNRQTVEVSSLDNPSLRRIIAKKGLVNPRGVAVHPARGKVFWSDWNRSAPKLEWANADGSDRQVFLEGAAVQLPNSLAIIWETDELCYADAGTKTIECIGIDSRQRRTIAANLTYPFGLAISDDHFYWTDWDSKKIERVDKNTTMRQPALDVPLGGSGNKLYGITAVTACPPVRGPCSGGPACPPSHLCLPNSSTGRSCSCGDPNICSYVEY